MKNLLILFSIFFITSTINAQEKSVLLKAKTVIESLAIGDVHIINRNTKIGTISNDNGFFEIPVKVGDSLYISHLNLKEKLIIVSKKIILDQNFTIQLEEKTYTLNEITLEKPRSIFYEDKDIGEYNGPEINAEILNLPYANTSVKKNNAIFKIESGAVVSLDNLFNSLNGNNRRAKLLEKMASEDNELSKIREKFTDDFFITDLKIKKEYINPFLNYCVDKNIINIFKANNSLKLTTLLLKESKTFPHKMLNENLFLSKK
jgi:hypothetical protein